MDNSFSTIKNITNIKQTYFDKNLNFQYQD